MIALLLQVTWAAAATCGTVQKLSDTTLKYVAPSSGTSCDVVVATKNNQATAKVNLFAADVVGGKPFGPMAALDAPSTFPFTASGGESSNQPAWLLDNLRAARARAMKVVIALPCGSHSTTNPGYCLTQGSDGVWRFDRAKFDARLALYDSDSIRAAISQAVAEGTLLAINLMDEPWVSGGDDGTGTLVGNTWGPRGTMTRARVDSLCADARKVFGPGVALGTSDNVDQFDPRGVTKICDVGIAQFSYRFGDPAAWRDSVLAKSRHDGYQTMFSFNILNGGTQDRDGTWDCGGAVKGQRSPNCAMTPSQMVTAVRVLGDASCGAMIFWRYDVENFALPTWVDAFNQMATIQSTRAPRPCKIRGL